MKKYLLSLIVAFGTMSGMAQNPTETIYQFELQLSNSENLDYRKEQKAFLIEILDGISEECYFDQKRSVYVIKTKENHNTSTLKVRIEAKGITVIGNIVKSDGNSATSTH